MRTDEPSPALHAAVLVTWLVTAARAGLELGAGRLGVAPLAVLGAWGALYLWLHAGQGRSTLAARIDLALQATLALALVRLMGGGIESALTVITAGQAPFLFSRRAALAGVALQAAALTALDVAGARSTLGGLLDAVPFVGFQLFAVGAAHLAERERRARRELGRLNAELLATRELLADSSRVGERLRIARDLHDSLGHYLTALSLQLEIAAHAGDAAAPSGDAAAERQPGAALERARALAKELLAQVREVVSALRAGAGVDLRPALTALVMGVPRPRIQLSLPPELTVASPAHAHALFACVQEIVTNALRHADAATLEIALTPSEGGLALRARDDGRGASALTPGHGLTGMRERIEQAGGRLELETSAGRGFEVRAWLPA